MVEVVELGANLPGTAKWEPFLQRGELVDVPGRGGAEDALEIGVGLKAGDEQSLLVNAGRSRGEQRREAAEEFLRQVVGSDLPAADKPDGIGSLLGVISLRVPRSSP